MNPQRRSSSCSSEPLRVWRSYSPPLHSTAHLHLLLAGVAGGTAPPTHLGPTRTRREPTTAQERDSIALRITVGRTIAQVFGRIGGPTTGPSWGGPIGRRLLGASTALGWPNHALGPTIDRKSGVSAQEIARGSGGASRSATPLTGSRTNPLPEPRSLPVRGSHAAPPRFRWTGASAPLALLSSPQLS